MKEIWDCALGFMDAQVLLTAEELGLFCLIDREPRQAPDIAAAAGLPQESTERLLVALCALGFVEKQHDGRYANTAGASEKLVRGKPGYVGAMFQHIREDLYLAWGRFKGSLADGQAQWPPAVGVAPAPTEHLHTDPQRLRAFVEGMHAITYEAGTEFARNAPELGEVRHIVDVGGAGGAFLISLAEAFPKLHGTVFDLPSVRPMAENFFDRYELADRLTFHDGDFWEDPMPSGADAYSLGFILHDWNTEGGSHLLEKIAKAARPGGLLIIGEYLLNEDRTGPLYVARMDLNMLVAAQGRERTADEYASWISRFGFALERIQPTSSGRHFLIARR